MRAYFYREKCIGSECRRGSCSSCALQLFCRLIEVVGLMERDFVMTVWKLVIVTAAAAAEMVVLIV